MTNDSNPKLYSTFCFLFALVFCSVISNAKTDFLATWISGSDIINQSGVYGTKAVAHPDNVPGSRSGSICWTDSNGVLWLFGGNGCDSTGANGSLNDLWKYDGTNWTWVSGSNLKNQYGSYGTKGVAAPSNVPGARGYSVSWIDSSGSLWLFGGYGYVASGSSGRLCDLWKFDGTNWIWISGSDLINRPGTYGTKGVPSPANNPGGRGFGVSWIDSVDNLWLFGGAGNAEHNDLWKFDGTSWTWISGSDTTQQWGIYGIQGIAEPNNVPGARKENVAWIDSADNLWLFGGRGYDSQGNRDKLNDLWKFDGTNWTWVTGSDTCNAAGWSSEFGFPDALNTPGALVNSCSWTDSKDNLYLFGGTCCASNYIKNALWKYDGVNWTCISAGSSAHYGTKGIPDPNNIPGARNFCISWIDSNDTLWLFGGLGYDITTTVGLLNDLWKIQILNHYYVDPIAMGDNNGSSWSNAFTSLDDALDGAISRDEIWVATSVYSPSIERGGTGDRFRAFQLVNGLHLYGGFGGDEINLDQRDISFNQTVLSGDIGVYNDPNDNCYHVFYHPEDLHLDPNTILDGFTITAGNADAPSDHGRRGGGMYNEYHCSPTISNCIFSNHLTAYAGGGIYNNDNCSPNLANCTFIENTAGMRGGGMYNENNSSPIITNCDFIRNTSHEASGIYLWQGSLTLTDCDFIENSAVSDAGSLYIGYQGDATVRNSNFINNTAGSGGGIYNDHSDSLLVINCTFIGNTVYDMGAGMFNQDNDPTIIGCMFANNSTSCMVNFCGGGGIYNREDSNPTIINCTFTNNSGGSGGGMFCWASSNPVITNSIFWGNNALINPEIHTYANSAVFTNCNISGSGGSADWDTNLGIDGGNNIDVNPMFADPNGLDRIAGTEDDHLRLSSNSPCIETGDNNAVTETTDLDGLDRIVDGDCNSTATVDMGAYEFDWQYIGDFEGGCDVNMEDFALLSANWLKASSVIDISPYPHGDGQVDIGELSVLIEHWLQESH